MSSQTSGVAVEPTPSSASEYESEREAVERAARARPGTAFKGREFRPMVLVLDDERFDERRIEMEVVNPDAERVIDYVYRLTVTSVVVGAVERSEAEFDMYTEAYRHFKMATPHCSARSFLFIDEA